MCNLLGLKYCVYCVAAALLICSFLYYCTLSFFLKESFKLLFDYFFNTTLFKFLLYFTIMWLHFYFFLNNYS